MNKLYHIWLWFLARFRLSDFAICEMSKDRGMCNDFHDYPDDDYGTPDDFIPLKCRRCGKRFYI